MVSVERLRAALERLPRVRLAHLPTPLEPMPRLSATLGDVELWIKRDDCTGLALGGNKTRQLEFTVGDAVARGADTLVQGAATESNHCRQAAAAAARLGLECHLVLRRDEHSDTLQGNLLLDVLLGARIHWTDAPLGDALEAAKEAVARELQAQGRKPYVIGGERGRRLSAAGYALQACELAEQCEALGLKPDAIYVCSAGATHAGLLLGLRALGIETRLQGVAPIRWNEDVPARIAATAQALAEELGLELQLSAAQVRHTEAYVGPDYGVLTREARAAIELTARTEGILLDPVYTGKAMAGLIDHIRRGELRPGSRIVFIHTGGVPALFRYADPLRAGGGGAGL